MKVCIVTHHPFWMEPLGCGSLIRSRYDYLMTQFEEVDVCYLRRIGTKIKCPYQGITVDYEGSLTREEIVQLSNVINSKRYALVYFSYYHFYMLAEHLVSKTICELHDVMHLRSQEFKKFGYDPHIAIDETRELSIIKKFDSVITISLFEESYLEKMGVRVFYVPPALTINSHNNHNRSHIGMLASQAKPNIDGFNFYSEAFKQIDDLVLAGPISECVPQSFYESSKAIKLGVLKDLSDYYSKVSISLSPIRFGAGLKIKVLESLSEGVPVFGTCHSFIGFPQGVEEITIAEDDIENWTLDNIIQLSSINKAIIGDYVKENFSLSAMARCFHDAINSAFEAA